MKPLGIILIVLALSVNAYNFLTLDSNQTLALLSQCAGAAALILMAFTQILATRLPIIESIFGAMDQSYRLHKWLGIAAFVAFYFHDTVEPEIEGTPESANHGLAMFLGEQGLNGLTVLIIGSILMFIPYHWWRWAHRFIGVFFVFCAGHYFLISKPFALASFTGLFIAFFCVVGTLAFIYTQLPRSLRAWKAYRISDLNVINDVTVLTLTPETTGIRHQAGQFAFLRLNDNKPKEAHPFTLSAAPNAEQTLQFSVKNLGDYTAKLPNAAKVGQRVDVQGGYGRFVRHPAPKTEIWIAGGIGITPFVAWAQAFTADDPATVHLFYCVKNHDEALHLQTLKETATRCENFHLHLIDSATMPRLTGTQIAEIAGDLSKAKAYFCGPAPMRVALGQQLRELGISKRRYHYEAFEMRTGIGAEYLLKKISHRIGVDIEGKITQFFKKLPF